MSSLKQSKYEYILLIFRPLYGMYYPNNRLVTKSKMLKYYFQKFDFSSLISTFLILTWDVMLIPAAWWVYTIMLSLLQKIPNSQISL